MNIAAYVSGRISRQQEIRDIISALKKESVTITRDWTWTDDIPSEKEAAAYRKKSYARLDEKYHQEAEDDLAATLAADVFIILTDELGSSMYVEMGAAFAGQKLAGKPRYIYAIGPHFDRMVFYQHHSVMRVQNVQEIIEDLKQKGVL